MEASRARSTSFPLVPLGEAVATVREVAKYGQEHSRNAFAQYLGHSTAYSGPFKSKLAAFRDWNFVVTSPDRVSLTPLAQRLAFPPDPNRVGDDLVEAFRACSPFVELYEACAKGQPLDKATIANNAVHRLRVSPAAKDRFATVFIESVSYAGLGEQLSDGGVRLLGERPPDAPQRETSGPLKEPAPVPLVPSRMPSAPGTVMALPWAVRGGRVTLSVELDRPLPAPAFKHLTEISSAVEALVRTLDSEREQDDGGQY